MTETWGQIAAMQGSHKWRVLRHIGMEPDSKTCVRCGDNLANEVRYCPGVSEQDEHVLPLGEQPTLPFIDRITGVSLG